jgi:hypothetical protein
MEKDAVDEGGEITERLLQNAPEQFVETERLAIKLTLRYPELRERRQWKQGIVISR